ncbi:hypothetical protein ACFLUV_04395 [Elusimicrobiota bacterium]
MKKVLFISAKLPGSSGGSSREGRLYEILEIISKKFKVYYLFSQTMFADTKVMKKYEEKGVEFINLKEITADLKGIEGKFKSILAEKFDIIVLNSLLEAKYYMPYIRIYSPDSIAVLNSKDIKYVLSSFSEVDKESLRDKVGRLNSVPEVFICSFMDMLMVENEEVVSKLRKFIPQADINIIPDTSDANKQGKNDLINYLENAKKKKIRKKSIDVKILRFNPDNNIDSLISGIEDDLQGHTCSITEIKTSKEELIESYNNAIKACNKDYLLIVTDNSILTTNAVRNMLFCMESNPSYGIIMPGYNKFEHRIDSEEWEEKYYFDNFANWKIVTQYNEVYALIRKELIDAVKQIDKNYKTLDYARLDYFWQAINEKFLVVVAEDSLVFNTQSIKDSKKDIADDYVYLEKKWEKTDTELLKSIEKPKNIK